MKLVPLVPEQLFILAPCRFISFLRSGETYATYLNSFDGKNLKYHPIRTQANSNNTIRWERVAVPILEFIGSRQKAGEEFFLIEED